ncbi:MAG: DUF1957 domain-containing protein [Planctomycetes bacterium]|nr:DUF1957 domain-containing protein [Planctomycetota bacterium]
MNGRRGSVCLVLHTHLPFIYHPEHASFLEESWLFEAITESYLPLLFVLRDLEQGGIPCRFAMSLTPPLATMLRLPVLQEKARRYLERRLELSILEVARRGTEGREGEAAAHYAGRHEQMLSLFDDLDGDLVAEFARHRAAGRIETLASGATHGFLPLFDRDASVRAQIRLGQQLHAELFGEPARGFWLPECAFRPGMEPILSGEGVQWVILDGHGVRDAKPRPYPSTFRPVQIGEGLFAFGRDGECSEQVWSSQVGYPGDPEYRELYRDLGYDADYHYIRPFLEGDGVRRNVGLKYHRITGRDLELHEKQAWSPGAARERARAHAENFLFNREAQIDHQCHRLGEEAVICAPFDTELFGHWWYEGPWFLEELFRQAHAGSKNQHFAFRSPSDVLDRVGSRPRVQAHASTWGRKGFNEVWLSDKNQWFWPYLHEMEARLEDWATRVSEPTAPERRLLDQMARELLLAQSSDWHFIVTMETSSWYAERRFRDHVHRFFALEDALQAGSFDEADLARVEDQDRIFPDLDFRIWGV